MNLKQYNDLTGDTKLAAALAIAMGWDVMCGGGYGCYVRDYGQRHLSRQFYRFQEFNPFTDASIPYGLLQEGAIEYCERMMGGDWQANVADYTFTSRAYRHSSKTHAIVNAYINADPMGHLAKFLKGEK